MLKRFQILVFMGIGFSAYSQFTIIPTGTTTDISDIVKHNDTIIISGKNNYFAKTFDFGLSIVPYPAPGLSAGYNFDFQIIDNAYYMVSGIGFPFYQSQILKSKNFGTTWQILNDTSDILFNTFTMIDTTYGIMAGLYGNYLYTPGCDSIWIHDTLYGSTSLHSLSSQCLGDSTLILLTVDGMAISTTNRGQSWYWGYCKDAIHKKIQFINKDTVYSISHESNETMAYFSKSVNGGHNFSAITLSPNVGDSTYYGTYFDTQIFDFYFDTRQHGFIVGYNYDINEGVIFETNDYGQNWTVYHTGFNEVFYSLLYVNDSTAFIGGSNGLLLKWNPSLPLNLVGINENLNNNISFQIFPNPANELLSIVYSGKNKVDEIIVTNVLGDKILTIAIENNHTTISTLKFPDGIYFISIRVENGVSTKKLIIQH